MLQSRQKPNPFFQPPVTKASAHRVAKTTAPARKTATGPRKRIDWDAVERDYRTTQLTLRELATKNACNHAAIARKAKDNDWQRDLTLAVRQATTAKLIAESVNSAVTSSQQRVTDTVLAAAELNKQVILGHRTRLAGLAEAVQQAKALVLSRGAAAADIREAAVFAQAVGNLATAIRTINEEERKAFNLDDGAHRPADPLSELMGDMGRTSIPVAREASGD